jgi:hypothetical protein
LQLKLSEMITANYNLLNIKEKNGKWKNILLIIIS